MADLRPRARQVVIPGHGIYFKVGGKLFTTPTPSFLSVPIEATQAFGTWTIAVGPWDQQGHNIEPPERRY